MAIASMKSHIFESFLLILPLPPLTDLEPTLLYGDNMGTIAKATNPDGAKTARSRHFDT